MEDMSQPFNVYGFETVTICGSMRFKPQMMQAAEDLSLMGWIVLMPFVTFKPGGEQQSSSKVMLDQMHFFKINRSSAIYVVNVGGYIGESTRNEIQYAVDRDKSILSLEPIVFPLNDLEN